MCSPLVGITADNRDNTADSRKYESAIAYARAVAEAGALPVILPHEPERAREYVERCDAIVLSGGADPRVEQFGQATHPKARPMDARRQTFELALLAALDSKPDKPVLGVCLGMQLMALHAGGKLDQYLPDTLGEGAAKVHQNDNRHVVEFKAHGLQSVGFRSEVVSWHRQAVNDPGRLRVVATAPDGVIEAIDAPARRFYVGVQWHPERMGATGDSPLGRGLYVRLVASARAT